MRMQHKREWYIPEGASPIETHGTDAAIYIKALDGGKVEGIAFHGRAQKPDWHYSFRNQKECAARVHSFIRSRRLHAEAKAKYAAHRNGKHSLKIGQVLYTSWGYEQTNVEWFQVTRLIGKTMVEVRQIGGLSEETGYMQGRTMPDIGNYTGEPLRRRARPSGSVRIDDVRDAWLWDGKPRSWSSYH